MALVGLRRTPAWARETCPTRVLKGSGVDWGASSALADLTRVPDALRPRPGALQVLRLHG
jgi:hypothetical protein